MNTWIGSYLNAGWKHWFLDPAWCSLQRWRRQFCPVESRWCWCCCRHRRLGVSSRSCWPGSICPAAVAPAVGSGSPRKPLLPRGLPVVPSWECSGWEITQFRGKTRRPFGPLTSPKEPPAGRRPVLFGMIVFPFLVTPPLPPLPDRTELR